MFEKEFNQLFDHLAVLYTVRLSSKNQKIDSQIEVTATAIELLSIAAKIVAKAKRSRLVRAVPRGQQSQMMH